jgi:nucleotide-binding universal stress UspA family protein
MADMIVVGTAGSDSAKRAVVEAIRVAKALDADLHLVSACEPRQRRDDRRDFTCESSWMRTA